VTTGMTPQDVHRAFETAFNRQDLEGIVPLYAPDAVMARPDGSLATGLDAESLGDRREELHRDWVDFFETNYRSNGEIVHTREYLLVPGTRR
jgi:ketosteroid isomerase-like protein